MENIRRNARDQKSFNTWLYEEFCSYDPSRFKGVGAMNLHDPQDMAKEPHQMFL